MPNRNAIYVRLPPGPLAWVAGLSDAAGVSRSDVVSDALNLLVADVLNSPNRIGLGAVYGHKYAGYIPGKEKRSE